MELNDDFSKRRIEAGMVVRSMAGILVHHRKNILMMHRAADRKLNPSLWAIPGGHVEPEEMNDPEKAALRELKEETGIHPEQITNFSLRYVMLAARGELRLHYDFVCGLRGEPPCQWPDSGEGTLHWIPKEEALSLPMPVTMRFVMEDWLARSPEDTRVRIGVYDGIAVKWSIVEDKYLDLGGEAR